VEGSGYLQQSSGLLFSQRFAWVIYLRPETTTMTLDTYSHYLPSMRDAPG